MKLGTVLPRQVAVLEVADAGPGIPAEHRQCVFQRLYRVEASRSRGHGGSGLGLSIAAAIVQAHGGRVELISAEGRGSTFRVLLPAPLPESAALSQAGLPRRHETSVTTTAAAALPHQAAQES